VSAAALNGWTTATVGGHAVDCFRPPGPTAGAMLFLHPVGGEMPRTNAMYTAAFARHALAVVAPFGGQGWWADRLCPEFDAHIPPEAHLLQAVLPWAEAEFGRSIRAIAGISMGGQGALRLGFKYAGRFPVVASVAGAFDVQEYFGRGTPLDGMYRSREACRQDTAILHLRPPDVPPHIGFVCDPTDELWFRGNDRLAEKLSAYGMPFTADLTTTAGGHSWAYFDAMADWLAGYVVAGLQNSARRLM
jgi:S-formylglutathione hydrolase FrmB